MTDWQAVAEAHPVNIERCLVCGRRDGLSFVAVAQGGAGEIASVCEPHRPLARRHYVDWLEHWARKDARA